MRGEFSRTIPGVLLSFTQFRVKMFIVNFSLIGVMFEIVIFILHSVNAID